MHVDDIAKQLPFTVEIWEIEYLSLVGKYRQSPIEAIKQIRQKVRKASNVASLIRGNPVSRKTTYPRRNGTYPRRNGG